MFGGAEDLAPAVSYVNYLVAGMTAAGLMSSSFQNLAITIPIERDAGHLKRLRGTPMPKSAYFTGKVALVLVLSVISTILLQFISGVFLPFTQLPNWLQTIGAIFPLKWMAQGLRYSFSPDSAEAAEAAHFWELDRVFLVLGA